MSAGELPKRDPRWIAAMAKRGITDFKDVLCLPLTVGPVFDPALKGHRLLNVPCVDTTGARDNLWGKPIENLIALVDLSARQVVSVTDLGVVPPPANSPSHAYAEARCYWTRRCLTPSQNIREMKGNGGALCRSMFYPGRAPDRIGKRCNHRQAQSCTGRSAFCGEIRYEGFRGDGVGHSMAGIVNAKDHSVGSDRAASGLYRYPSSVWHCVPGIDDEIEDDIVEFALNTVERLQIRTDGDYQFVGWAKYPAERRTQPFKHLLDLNGA